MTMGKAKKSPDEMTFLEHLEDLRKRLFYSFIAVFVGVIPCWVFAKPLYNILARPVTQYLPAGTKLAFTHLTAPFMLYMKTAFMGGLVLTSPFIFLQLWYFVAPGLYRKEKKYVFPFVFLTTLLFRPRGPVRLYHRLPLGLPVLHHPGVRFPAGHHRGPVFHVRPPHPPRDRAHLRAPDPRLFPVPDRRHHRPLDDQELQVRRARHLRHRRGHHAHAGHDHPEHRGGSDDRALRDQHPHRPGRAQEQGTAEESRRRGLRRDNGT